MQIMNNSAAMAALGELKKNDTTLGKQLKKVASGMKINGAGDGASEYAISEKMRVRLRSLGQDIANAQTGKNLVRTAEGGIQEIVSNLRNMKAMAINSANDHNTDADRATIDKEFQQRIEEIDDIANTTNYNGRLLLRGDYGDHYLYKNRPTGSPTVLPLGTTSISADGVYTLPVGFTGTVYVAAGQNIELRQEDSSTPLHDVYIVGPSGGNANVWINGLNVVNEQDGSIIKFQGSNNHLTILGNNTISYSSLTTNYNKAVINAGNDLTLEGTGTLNVANTGEAGCAAIGVDEGDTSSVPNITINSGTYNITVNKDGAAIGGSFGATVGDITINGGTLNVKSYTGAGIGGSGGTAAHAADSNAHSRTGKIIIGKNATVTAHSDWSAGIGSGCAKGYTESIKISKYATVNATSTHGEAIGRGVTGTVGSIDLAWDDSNVNEESSWTIEKYQTSLVIHDGTKANQNLHVFIKDMRSTALGLDGINVSTRDKSYTAMSALDDAIDYALDNQTRMGAYQSRLDYTASNLTTSSENTQASESTIRDADMARAMTAYTKANVLAQSAQAMLAQANQNASSVLSLLG
ncbi:MAG: flagellin [Selenomonadaceae bacterium]|nr:flagellin [Selenomonadaceae bacterium]